MTTAQPCGACHSKAHHIQACPQIARFDIETYLREQNLYLYDAIGSALACLRGDSLDGAIYLLQKAMGGTTMTTGRFELRQDEDTGRRYWFGSEDGWKDATEVGEDGTLTMSAEHFSIGAVLCFSEPDPPPPPEENPDKDSTPQTEGPSPL